ncbi:MAG: enoyl-CoA hydratase [Halioglobus sp.]|nr:enoyl-CoA hydratase [Halioglobus sp.]|tara:strand:- start:318 stop:1106 length:789 start_codon:yes stop_codon:yes gene_type:complete
MSEYDTIAIERHDAVAVVSLNRPDALNSFDNTMRRELLRAVREVNDDDSVRVVVLTGAGRAFSAGADLNDMPQDRANWRVEDDLNGEYKPSLMEIYQAPKPWISAINGACAGIGSAYGMVCDLTVMADNAYLYQAFAAISLIPDGGATWHLARTLGRKRAYEIIVTGEKLAAQKCLDWGLCNRVSPADSLLEETLAWAQEIAGKAPLSLRYAKQTLSVAMEEGVDSMISIEARNQHICITSEDAAEGMTAFLQKRTPVWKGR